MRHGEAVRHRECRVQGEGAVRGLRRHGVRGDMPGALLPGGRRAEKVRRRRRSRQPGVAVAGDARGGAVVRPLLGRRAVRAVAPRPPPRLQGQARRQV